MKLSTQPRAWVIVRPSQMIVAFNTNGSLAHSLSSPGNGVPQSVKGPLSYYSAWTNLRWHKPTALSPPLSPCLYVCSPSLCPSALADRIHTERTRLYHSCGVVRQLVMGVLCHCRQIGRRSLVSLWCITMGSHDWWREAFPTEWGPPGLLQEECSRRRCSRAERGSEAGCPADNSGHETDRFDMWACPHLCWWKETPQAMLPETETVNTVTPPSEKATHIRQNSSNALKPSSISMSRLQNSEVFHLFSGGAERK